MRSCFAWSFGGRGGRDWERADKWTVAVFGDGLSRNFLLVLAMWCFCWGWELFGFEEERGRVEKRRSSKCVGMNSR